MGLGFFFRAFAHVLVDVIAFSSLFGCYYCLQAYIFISYIQMLSYVCLGFSVNFRENILSSHIPLIFYSPRLSFLLLSLQGTPILVTSFLFLVWFLLSRFIIWRVLFLFIGFRYKSFIPRIVFIINYPIYSFFFPFFFFCTREGTKYSSSSPSGVIHTLSETSDSDQTWSYFSFVIGRAVYQRFRGSSGYYISIVVRNFFLYIFFVGGCAGVAICIITFLKFRISRLCTLSPGNLHSTLFNNSPVHGAIEG